VYYAEFLKESNYALIYFGVKDEILKWIHFLNWSKRRLNSIIQIAKAIKHEWLATIRAKKLRPFPSITRIKKQRTRKNANKLERFGPATASPKLRQRISMRAINDGIL
jgi:hypothetical protein